MEQLQKLLEQELSPDPNLLSEQLRQVEAWHSRLVDAYATSKNPDKARYSGYRRVLEKRLSLGQTLMRHQTESVKRMI